MHPLIERLLSMRGVDSEEVAEAFLQPKLSALGDPFLLPETDRMVERLLQAVDRSETVVLYGDYDVDGVTSMALMSLVLRAYGLQPKTFLPHRMDEGYGLSADGLARCFEEHGRPGLLVALDCGTTSHNELAWLAEHGIDCVIVDHHELAPQGRPPCVALMNPKLGDTYHYFCTAGLVFKLAHALMKRRRLPSFDLKKTLDLVALGTVADLVPLVDENRILVRRGLEAIARTQRVGLKALKEVTGTDGLVQTHHVGYRLGPRLNAAGRLDNALTSLQLLLAEDPEVAREHAELLDAHNRERQAVEAEVLQEALSMVEALGDLDEIPALVLESRTWHPGVVGIVASRLSRLCHRPTILIAIDEQGMGKGSGRSIPGFSLVEAIDACRDHLVKGGGHAMAAGISVHEDQVAAFREAFTAFAGEKLSAEDLLPCLEIDAELQLPDLAPPFLEGYRLMEPFGQQNPEPVFLCTRVHPRLPGRVLKEKHLKIGLSQGSALMEAMWFNAPLDRLPPPPWDVALRIQRNWYRGMEQWQLTIEDVRSST